MKYRIQILYEDEDLLIVNKPPGLLTIPDRHAPEKFNLFSHFVKKYGKIFTVHRLDKETSGVLCFAKNETAHRHLSLQFESRKVGKIYQVLVEGRIHLEEGVIDKPIAAAHTPSGKMHISKKGKPAVTVYKVVELFKNYTLLEASIKTGRTHQIRVHFESIGYPLAIDSTYGRKSDFYLSDLKLRKYKLGKGQEEKPLMTRLSLHASQLRLKHPEKEESMTFEAPLSKDFKAVIKQLQKWGK